MNRQSFVDRLLETENLTDRLEDEEADYLLKWGIALIDELLMTVKNEDEAGAKVNRLMNVMRGLNSLGGDPANATQAAIIELRVGFLEIFGSGKAMDEDECRSIAEHVSKMDSRQVLAYLSDWLSHGRHIPKTGKE